MRIHLSTEWWNIYTARGTYVNVGRRCWAKHWLIGRASTGSHSNVTVPRINGRIFDIIVIAASVASDTSGRQSEVQNNSLRLNNEWLHHDADTRPRPHKVRPSISYSYRFGACFYMQKGGLTISKRTDVYTFSRIAMNRVQRCQSAQRAVDTGSGSNWSEWSWPMDNWTLIHVMTTTNDNELVTLTIHFLEMDGQGHAYACICIYVYGHTYIAYFYMHAAMHIQVSFDQLSIYKMHCIWFWHSACGCTVHIKLKTWARENIGAQQTT